MNVPSPAPAALRSAALPPFEEVVQRHGPTVLRVCRAALGPGPDADDAWSETFLAALRAWPGLSADTVLEAWLVRVASRKAIDIHRARARRAEPRDDLTESESARAGSDPADGLSIDDGSIGPDSVWLVVAQLPPRQREAIAYHYLGGLGHHETAQLTGSTPAAVRRASSDGLKALRRRLGEPPPARGVPPAPSTPPALSARPGNVTKRKRS